MDGLLLEVKDVMVGKYLCGSFAANIHMLCSFGCMEDLRACR